ncbi:MAG: DUF1987 domain-containing protein [Flavobacteriales bacterium]|nr:DUF1987 domain-containing protein [Flavobacteriales bacterium]
MESIKIAATENSPEIYFDLKQNIFRIKGKSIVTEVDKFYSPVLDWLKFNQSNISNRINFVFDLEYFNIFSSKRILFILYYLSDLREKGVDVRITWYFSQEDDDMKEVGEDYACMVNIPFDFVSKSVPSEII